MKAIAITRPGGPEVLQMVERPDPVAGLGECLISVEASGVNRPDVLQRKGLYPPPPGASDLPGLEVAGRIVAGDAQALAAAGFQLGDAVCALVPGWWLCATLRDCGRAVPAGSGRLEHGRGNQFARGLLHGLVQCLRSGGFAGR